MDGIAEVIRARDGPSRKRFTEHHSSASRYSAAVSKPSYYSQRTSEQGSQTGRRFRKLRERAMVRRELRAKLVKYFSLGFSWSLERIV